MYTYMYKATNFTINFLTEDLNFAEIMQININGNMVQSHLPKNI